MADREEPGTYTVSQAAGILGISPHTIRYYHREGLLPYVERDSNGRRMLTGYDLNMLRMLTLYSEAGIPIRMLKELVQVTVVEDDPERGLEILYRARTLLQGKKDALDAGILQVEDAISRYNEEIKIRTEAGAAH